jgi:hypothetical protein
MRIITLALFLAGCLQAGDFNGTWKANYTSPDGRDRETKFVLQTVGSSLTGIIVDSSEETPIQDGKVIGDNISFSVVSNVKGEQWKVKFTGELAGDTIQIKIDYGDGAFEITAKRTAK